MASSISAGTTSSTALVATADTSGALQLATNNGTVAVTIDTSQNVGIGATVNSVFDQVAASRPLVVQKSDSSTTLNGSAAAITIANGNTTTSNTAQLNFAAITGASTNQYSSAIISCIFGARTNAQYPTGILTFSTSTSLNSAPTEKMRIDSSGNVLVGTTSGNADARTTISQGNTDSSPCTDFYKGSATTTTSQVFARFFVSGGSGGNGSITANGAATAAFTAFSDRRLKENIVDLPPQLANIMALRPVEFDYIGMANGHQIGFIAQEVQAVYPDLVSEGADEMLTLTDMNKNDARLIKAIQEQQALITSLTARIVALEGTPA